MTSQSITFLYSHRHPSFWLTFSKDIIRSFNFSGGSSGRCWNGSLISLLCHCCLQSHGSCMSRLTCLFITKLRFSVHYSPGCDRRLIDKSLLVLIYRHLSNFEFLSSQTLRFWLLRFIFLCFFLLLLCSFLQLIPFSLDSFIASDKISLIKSLTIK